MNKIGPQDLWKEAIERVRPEIGDDNVDLWLKPAEALDLNDHTLRLKVPNKFFVEWIRDHYQLKLESSLKSVAGATVSIEFNVAKEIQGLLPAADPIPPVQPQSDFTLSELNPRYTFSTFIVGASNRFAHATGEAICKNPGKQFNPFFLYGGVGLGKTHLMHAIGHAIRTQNERARVLYTTSEQFVNEYINSLRYDKPDSFRSKYRHLDCLLIDDIQFIIAKGRSEEEFFYTFNALFDSRKQIVISSDRAPKEMAPSEQRLISRFEWGVVADIKPPDLETRIAILKKKAEAEQLFIPDDVILFIAGAIKTNIRELEGSLIRLSAFASLTGGALTVDTAKEILKDSITSEYSTPVRLDTIQKLVCQKYSVDMRALKSRSRTNEIAFPRQLAMYLACTLTDLSTTDIGSGFGGRDHTTVIHARDKISGMLERDPFFLESVNKLTEQIRAVDNT